MVFRNWRAVSTHRALRRHGEVDDGVVSFIGLLPSEAYTDQGAFSGVSYGYHIGYIWMLADWHAGSDRSSWFEHQSINMPLLNDSARDRLYWLPQQLSMEAQHLFRRVSRK